MSAVGEKMAPVNWTIAEKLAVRDAAREAWDTDFTSNMKAVADKIAESITLTIFEALGSRLADSYAPPLSADAALHLNYSLALKRDSGKIKEWAKEGAELKPFKEWFQAFEAASQKRKEGHIGDIEFASKSFVRVADKNIEIDYFQGHMSKIGHLLTKSITANLEAFAAQPDNKALRYKVEWYKKAEKIISNPSNLNDDLLTVTVWTDSKGSAKAQAAASKKADCCVII